MKRSIADLAKTAPGATPGIPGLPGGGGFLTQLTDSIRQFKEALQLIKELRGVPGEMNQARENQAVEPGKQPVNLKLLQQPPDPIMPIIALLEILDRAGHGDKTIGQLIKDMSPFTLKQVKGILTNARTRK